jgi:hypothetical protein
VEGRAHGSGGITRHTSVPIAPCAPVPPAGGAAGTLVAVGETVDFSGGATVPGTGALPPSALSWRADLLHCPVVDQCHRHPGIPSLDGAASGSFAMPDHDYPSAVELHLSATWQGETVTATRRCDLHPRARIRPEPARQASAGRLDRHGVGPRDGDQQSGHVPVPCRGQATSSAPHDSVVPDFPVLVVANYEPVD